MTVITYRNREGHGHGSRCSTAANSAKRLLPQVAGAGRAEGGPGTALLCSTDSSEATRGLCWPLVLKSLRKPWFCQFLGHCRRVSLLTWGLYAVPLQETWPMPPPWQSPHDSFFYGPLFLVVPTPRLLMFIHSETSSPTHPSIVSHACPPLPPSLPWPLCSIHLPKC